MNIRLMTRRIAMLLCLMLLCPLLPAWSEAPEISVLQPEEIPPTPKGVHHYLLVCMDSWNASPDNLSYSDGMLLVTIDEVAGRIILTSFLRDSLMIHPDGKPGRLTYIMKSYGIQGLMDTLNSHFGLRIEKYILMDWMQVQTIVDIVGGVHLTVTDREAGYLKRYAITPDSTTPAMDKAGDYHFRGHAAVIYMRIRRVPALNGDKYDMGRTFRARYVLSNIADSLKDVPYEAAYDMFREIFDSIGARDRFFETNISMAELLDAFHMVFDLRGTRVEQFRLPIDGAFEQYNQFGGAAILMDLEVNRAVLKEFLFEHSFVVAPD